MSNKMTLSLLALAAYAWWCNRSAQTATTMTAAGSPAGTSYSDDSVDTSSAGNYRLTASVPRFTGVTF